MQRLSVVPELRWSRYGWGLAGALLGNLSWNGDHGTGYCWTCKAPPDCHWDFEKHVINSMFRNHCMSQNHFVVSLSPTPKVKSSPCRGLFHLLGRFTEPLCIEGGFIELLLNWGRWFHFRGVFAKPPSREWLHETTFRGWFHGPRAGSAYAAQWHFIL